MMDSLNQVARPQAPHYICTGGCRGVSNTPGSCNAKECKNSGKPLEKCLCTDNRHGGLLDRQPIKLHVTGPEETTSDENATSVEPSQSTTPETTIEEKLEKAPNKIKHHHVHAQPKCDVLALGLSVGLVWGLGMFLLGVTAWLFDWGTGWVQLLSDVYVGFTPSAVGVLIGLGYGLVDGFIGGALIAWLYNMFRK